MSTKIAVLSDTHGLLRPEVLEQISDCDVILHAGDINNEKILDALRPIGKMYVVRGNNDKDWSDYLSQSLYFTVEGVRFFMVHNKKDVPASVFDGNTDVIIYGHSHSYREEYKDGLFWLNPGSCGRRRFNQEITFAIMTVYGTAYEIEKIVIPQQTNQP